ncbi:AAA family ATPase [Fibrobacter sp.]|uniref:AAA family ATPase n=1 Tax=Fibrobacter sp. TaxID=35828 RepID=UPI00386F6B79
MNYVKSGSTYTPIGSLREVTNVLEPHVYQIVMPPMSGPKLEIVDNIDLSIPKKVYGKVPSQVDKCFAAYDRRPRNTGVLLSGERGMGKTLFIRIAMNEALKRDIPVIVLSRTKALEAYVGLINSITQPVLVVMDEFEKNFDTDDKSEDQGTFLSMLDGLGSSQKRMFIASVNYRHKISQFMINRPGRFYYHFEFKPLSDVEMIEYLTNETKGVDQKSIKYAVQIMQNYPINYDGLSAIADELNAGLDINETLRDLNLDRIGVSALQCSVNINGYDYSGTLNMSIDSLQSRETVGIDMRSVKYVGSNSKLKPSTKGFIGNEISVYLSAIKMTMDETGIVRLNVDESLDYIYLEENIPHPTKKGDTICYLHMKDIKSVSEISIRPKPIRSAPMYLTV